jgi:hypothetical protein
MVVPWQVLTDGNTQIFSFRCYVQFNWIKSFLAGRTQRVIVEGVASDTAPVTSGVSQGTVLHTLSMWLFHDKFWLMVIPIYFPLDVMFNSFPWFLIYINDLPSKVNSTATLFADDCLLYRHIKTNEDTTSLQDDPKRHWHILVAVEQRGCSI